MPTPERIVRDFAGSGGHLRYTHEPSGVTCFRRPWMIDRPGTWEECKREFFAHYPDVPVVTITSGRPVDPVTDLAEGETFVGGHANA